MFLIKIVSPLFSDYLGIGLRVSQYRTEVPLVLYRDGLFYNELIINILQKYINTLIFVNIFRINCPRNLKMAAPYTRNSDHY